MISITNISRAVSVTGLVFLFLVFSAADALAQASVTATDGTTPPGIAPGSPAGAYALSGFENVNLYSGNLNVRLPLLKIGGRGAAQTGIMLALNTHRWRVARVAQCSGSPPPPDCSFYNYFPTPNWWSDPEPGYGPGVMIGRYSGENAGPSETCVSPRWATTLTRLTFIAADGTEYELRDQQSQGRPLDALHMCPDGPPRGTVFVTRDGTSATFISDSEIRDSVAANSQFYYPTGTLVMRDGTRYRILGGLVDSITDRNGNNLKFTYVSTRVTKIVDSLRREVNISYDIFDSATQRFYDRISFKGTNGALRTIEIWRNHLHNSLRNDFPTTQTFHQLFPQLDGSSTTHYDPNDKISEVKLPDGRIYKFLYNPHGEVARIELPTGGAYEYDYGGGAEGVTATGHILDRKVIERRTFPNGGFTPESRMTYEVEKTIDPVLRNLTKITVKHFNGSNVTSQDEHYFYGWSTLQPQASAGYPEWREGREYKTRMLDPVGSMLREENHMWDQPNVSWWQFEDTRAPSNNPRIDESIMKIDGGLQSRQEFDYDDYLNKTEVREYDLGPSPSGGLLRRSSTVYSSTEDINGIDYTSNLIHLPSLPVRQTVKDGSGMLMAQTEYEYDVYSGANHAALQNRTDLVGHDGVTYGTSYLRRGNLTASKVWLNTTGNLISTFQQYDIAGNVVKAIDALGNPTTIDFTDRFGSPNGQLSDVATISELAPNKKTYAFPSSATNALLHTATTQFDYYTGAVVDSKDANGVVTTAFYNDLLDRPTLVELRTVEGGSVFSRSNFFYGLNPLSVTVTKDLNSLGDGSLRSVTLFDGFGRTTESRQYENASAYIATKQEYDWMGRVRRSNNPHRSVSEDTYGYTETTYDAISRVKDIKTFDRNGILTGTVTTSYSGNQTTVIDQAGKRRRSIADG